MMGIFSTFTDFFGVMIKMQEERNQKLYERVNEPDVVTNNTLQECYETQAYYNTVEHHDTAPTNTHLYGPTRTREGEILNKEARRSHLKPSICTRRMSTHLNILM